jgi:hypothetical protein
MLHYTACAESDVLVIYGYLEPMNAYRIIVGESFRKHSPGIFTE